MARWKSELPSKEELHLQKKEKIIHEAALQFSQNGYLGTNLLSIAKTLGVTKTALYYYFKDKPTLLHACMQTALKGVLELRDSINQEQTNTGYQKLQGFLESYITLVIKNNFQFLMFFDIDQLKPEHLSEIQGYRDEFDAGVRSLILEGIGDGSLQDGNPKIMSLTILGAVNWIARWFRLDGELSIEEVAKEVISTSLRGLQSR